MNLPRADKMARPRYQEIAGDEIPGGTGRRAPVQVVAGEVFGMRGPVDTHSPIVYVHVTLQPGASLDVPVPAATKRLTYVISGSGPVR